MTALGIKLSTAVVGFVGGVMSLAFIQNLTRWQAFQSVVIGTLSANYVTPVVVEYYKLPADMSLGIAFLIGMFAMSIVPAVKAFVFHERGGA